MSEVKSIVTEFKGQYYFLSNFYHSPFLYKDILWPTSEHAFQAMKVTHVPVWKVVAQLPTPREAKIWGRSVEKRGDWNNIRVDVMRDVLRAKFLKPGLAARLRYTGDAILQEGNTWGDTFWGIDLRTGKGENWLGRVLMEVRDEISSLL